MTLRCMKCGAETPDTQVFCDHCLQVMQQYPVQHDAHVHLPKRSASGEAGKKTSRKKRAPTPEEQIATLKGRIFRLRILVAALLLLSVMLGSMLGFNLYQQYYKAPTGREYTVDTSANG